MLIYLHIPYCDSKCHYCSFNSYVDKFETQRNYMQALYQQLSHDITHFALTPHSVETVFIGGGTPSTIDATLYQPIFDLLSPYLQQACEITTEANPNSATKKWLEGMRDLGVNRISFGVQSFDAQKLKSLNRAHTPTQAKQAITDAKEVGFEHLSLDLIYNYQGDTKTLLSNDIKEAFTLPIDHLSAYELTIENGTKFANTPEVRQEDETLAFFVAQEIEKYGFKAYEISNFGGYQSRHNKGYWQLKNYIGAGAGAVGFWDNTRYYPHSAIEAYIADPLYRTEEFLSAHDLLTEHIFLGLRSTIGVAKSLLSDTMTQKATLLCEKGKLLENKTHYYNPNFFLSDELALYILD